MSNRASGPVTRYLIGWLLVFATTLAAVTATLDDPGLTWDEPAYLHSARGDLRVPPGPPQSVSDYYHRQCGALRWLRRVIGAASAEERRRLLSRDAVLRAWDYNRYGPNFHPPLSGLMAIAGHLVSRPWLSELASWRFASGVQFAAVVACLYVVIAARFGPWPGLVAAAALGLTPRVFGHAHIFGTDTPTLFIWVLTALAFWRGFRSRPARLAFGALAGLAFITKMNALAVLLPLTVWTAFSWLNGARPTLRTAAAGALILAALAPLALAVAEVDRQARLIRVQTKRELLRQAATLLQVPLPRGLDAADESRLETMALQIAEQAAQRRGILPQQAPESPAARLRQLAQQLAVPQLVLDDYIKYIWADQLRVPSAISRVVLALPLVPLAVWLLAVPARVASQNPAIATAEMVLTGAAFGPIVAIALNPTWWFDTYTQLALYYLVSVGRKGALPDIEVFYLAQKYIYSLPWHNGFVLVAVTVPVLLLVWAVVGLSWGLGVRSQRAWTLYVAAHLLTLPLLRMFPVPAHDGVRLMLPTFWFLAAAVGLGFAALGALLRRFEAGWGGRHATFALAALVTLLPCAVQLVRIHPYELSYYNLAVGGLPGAQQLGFETTYWYDAVTDEVLAKMNDLRRGLPRGAVLHPPSPKSNTPVFGELQDMGKLREDIRLDVAPASGFPYMWLLTHSAKSTPFSRVLYALAPRLEHSWNGVRLFSIYDPRQVARAYALTLFLRDVDAEPGPRVATELVRVARESPSAVVQAAVLLVELGPDQAQARLSRQRRPVRVVVAHLLRQRHDLDQLLQRAPGALTEAAEILVQAAQQRPEVLHKLIEYPGYLSHAELGEFLDASYQRP